MVKCVMMLAAIGGGAQSPRGIKDIRFMSLHSLALTLTLT